ncbi:MAG: hypothetical protein CSA62_06770 [Planctomycetota bacterium]|nr:MAG: hypothetical protein CSA62_06770 [Planctomycetota bacterium]
MITLEYVVGLYERYASDLKAVRAQMRAIYRKKGVTWAERIPGGRALRKIVNSGGGNRGWQPAMIAQLDDIAAEVTYLLLRDRRPEVVVEISPCHGWSTCWILSALRDNGGGGCSPMTS